VLYLSLIVFPLLLAGIIGGSLRSDRRRRTAALRELFAERGLAVSGDDIRSLRAEGVVDGVALRLEHRTAPKLRTVVRVHAERAGAGTDSVAAPRAGDGEGAPAPAPSLAPEAAEQLARAALTEEGADRVDVTWSGAAVELEVPGMYFSLPRVDRCLDIARALLDLKQPSPARKARARDLGDDHFAVAVFAAVVAFLVALVGSSCIPPVQRALSPVACRPGEILASEVEIDQGAGGVGHSAVCRSADGSAHDYGMVTGLVAGLNVTFPALYLGGLVWLAARRRRE
jgi:hypothetical protein